MSYIEYEFDQSFDDLVQSAPVVVVYIYVKLEDESFPGFKGILIEGANQGKYKLIAFQYHYMTEEMKELYQINETPSVNVYVNGQYDKSLSFENYNEERALSLRNLS